MHERNFENVESSASYWLIDWFSLLWQKPSFNNHDTRGKMDLPENGAHLSKAFTPKFPCFWTPNDVLSPVQTRSFIWMMNWRSACAYSTPILLQFCYHKRNIEKAVWKLFSNEFTSSWTSTVESLDHYQTVEHRILYKELEMRPSQRSGFFFVFFSGSFEIFNSCWIVLWSNSKSSHRKILLYLAETREYLTCNLPTKDLKLFFLWARSVIYIVIDD